MMSYIHSVVFFLVVYGRSIYYISIAGTQTVQAHHKMKNVKSFQGLIEQHFSPPRPETLYLAVDPV